MEVIIFQNFSEEEKISFQSYFKKFSKIWGIEDESKSY
ncbi:hypothetical protein TSIB_0255 [Thermococcus sibiricus MM 739]|uniref:Uncharacterized protein n=1 Tax=Thermococcus sibiricus (strain DSM 12597 / MM 739) TaxID=604354 RepID=C6A127_THESM|nr:hypothetical protein TSIB_0255 [Thermococcus sibiricus MM 739]